MRMSEAILLGSTLLKPVSGVFMTDDGTGGCAYGMARKAGWGSQCELETMLVAELPCGCGKHDEMVMGGCRHMFDLATWPVTVSFAIVHLFNQHVCDGTWTIEQLADWVREQEDRLEGLEQQAQQPEAAEPVSEYSAV